MPQHHIKTLWIYWALLAAGTILSFGIFTALIQNFNGALWLAVCYGLAMAGLRMTYLGINDLRDNLSFKVSRHVLLGVAVGFPLSVFAYFGVYVLGYFIFYFDYICWAVFSFSTIYYAAKIWRLPSDLRKTCRSGCLSETRQRRAGDSP